MAASLTLLTGLWQGAEKVHQRYRKVKAEAKAETKKVRSSLNLDLDLSLSRSAILRDRVLLPRTRGPLDFLESVMECLILVQALEPFGKTGFPLERVT